MVIIQSSLSSLILGGWLILSIRLYLRLSSTGRNTCICSVYFKRGWMISGIGFSS